MGIRWFGGKISEVNGGMGFICISGVPAQLGDIYPIWHDGLVGMVLLGMQWLGLGYLHDMGAGSELYEQVPGSLLRAYVHCLLFVISF